MNNKSTYENSVDAENTKSSKKENNDKVTCNKSYRFKITIEYDGTGLLGWQKQPEGPSVQEAIENSIYSFSNQKVDVQGAGRTDSGVHAYSQVAHFDLETDMSEYRIRGAINAHLRLSKTNISILLVEKVDKDFNARFDAKKRSYIYKIINQKPYSPLNKNRSWHVSEDLDLDKMIEASKFLLGTHDFSSFRAAACQANSPIRTLDKIEISKNGNEITLYFEALSFLHNQIRNIVGTLKMVGCGAISPPSKIKDILEAKDRTKAGVAAPAHGLYMYKIWY